MEMLDPRQSPQGFYEHLATARRRILLLDYDGTLAPFRAQRRRAVPYPGVRRLLNAIAQDARNRVVVVSGRTVAEVLFLLRPAELLEVWGCHGAQRLLTNGAEQKKRLDPRARQALSQAAAWASGMGWGAQVEQKPFSVALHWRGLDPDQAQRMRRLARAQFRRLSSQAALEPLDFDGGLELRAAGVHKGQAVETILGEEGPDACLAYLGDDLTDEDAFQAVKGHGLGVLVRDEPRPSAASLWLRPPGELLEFLEVWLRTGRELAGAPPDQPR